MWNITISANSRLQSGTLYNFDFDYRSKLSFIFLSKLPDFFSIYACNWFDEVSKLHKHYIKIENKVQVIHFQFNKIFDISD